MADPTRMIRHNDYEEMWSSYQCVQVAVLDAALRRFGITDVKVLQKVCESFLFEMGNLHDQGWIRPSGGSEPVYPLLCFSKRFLNTDTPIDELGDVYAPSPGFSFHEYAHGNAGLLYEGDPAAQVETGDFAGDDPGD